MATVREQSHGRVPERVSFRLGGTIKNAAGVAIAGSALTTATLTIYDVVTGTPVTGYDDRDVKSLIGADGVYAIDVLPIGSSILNPKRPEEAKVALLEFTYNSGAEGGMFRHLFTVVNEALRS